MREAIYMIVAFMLSACSSYVTITILRELEVYTNLASIGVFFQFFASFYFLTYLMIVGSRKTIEEQKRDYFRSLPKPDFYYQN
jgi:hypothetical protein